MIFRGSFFGAALLGMALSVIAQPGRADVLQPPSSGIPLRGFGDIGAAAATSGAQRGFRVGSLDFYLTPELGERTRALVELVFEIGGDGGVATDLERIQLAYVFGDELTAWIGRFHTPYGYYNTAYHHGQQVATAVRRAQFIDFEDKGGILPAHSIGPWLTGAIKAGGGRVTYDLYAGNSPRIVENTLDMNNAGTTNHNFTNGANLGYEFRGALDGLKLGGHLMRTRVEDDQAPVNTTQVNVWGGYAVYDTERWELLSEVYRFRNDDVSGGSGVRTSTAGFAQLALRHMRWTPYVRAERASFDQADNYFAQQEFGFSYTRGALGLRYDLDARTAIKGELARTRVADRGLPSYSEALVQFAFRF